MHGLPVTRAYQIDTHANGYRAWPACPLAKLWQRNF